jgi:membrane peptidoglycan carboxypeptidase
MKPITYLAAFMKGWAPATIIVDEPLRITDGESSTCSTMRTGAIAAPCPPA